MSFVTKQTGIAKRTGYFYEGKEIALAKRQGHTTKDPKRHRGTWHPEEVKIEAATLHAVTRDFNKTHELTGIGVYVLKKWAVEPWWDECIAKVKQLKNEQLDAKITSVLEQAVDIIAERLKDGDIYVDHNSKEKTQYRIPIKARDAVLATGILFDKRQLIRGEATSVTTNQSTAEKFLALKENFERLARSRNINPNSEPIEGEVNAEELTQVLTAEEETVPKIEITNSIKESIQAEDLLNAEEVGESFKITSK